MKPETRKSVSIFGLRLPIAGSRGYTLIELIIAVGLFAVVMTLATGAYLIVIGVNRRIQSTVIGIDNLSFALDTMTRDIRTGTNYNCGGTGDCPSGASTFSFTDQSGRFVSYRVNGSAVQETVNGVSSVLTDPSVTVSSLTFYASGTARPPRDYLQPHVTMLIGGTVATGPGKTEPFAIEAAATMRGSDL